MKSVSISMTGVRCLLTALLAAAAAAQSTMNDQLTQNDCERNVNGSIIYQACDVGPEHLLAPNVTAVNVTIDPPDSTCGLTPQKSCTLVRITASLQGLHAEARNLPY